MPVPTISHFWGKYSPKTGESLSLLAHVLDVAVVFRALCDLDAIRHALNSTAGVVLDDVQLDRLAVLVMLHDIGKANLGFQDKILPGRPAKIGHIRELVPLFCDEALREKFLGVLPRGIGEWFSSEICADSYFFAIFSHHGRPTKFTDSRSGSYWIARERWWHSSKTRDPFRAIAEISLFAERAFPQAFSDPADPFPDEPRFHHRFAGLVMLADWLGSHNHWFPVKETTAEERLAHDIEVVPCLLKAVGLDTKHFRLKLMATGDRFESRFKFPPNPTQNMVDDLDPLDSNNCLVTVESETGSGKTEAALNWFCKLFVAGKVDSLYFALPTRVAARELYNRINGYISSWFPDPECRPVTLLAVPGYAQIDGYSVKEVMPDGDTANLWQEDPDTLYLEKYWAGTRPKRFLAATIAVGTIDQALLSIVQTAHAHLRSVCLDRSLLVVDEVHASDMYMSRLLLYLLTHHLGAGGNALLLSATLGSRALSDYTKITKPDSVCPEFKEAIKAPYPSLTLSDGYMVAPPPTEQIKEVLFDLRKWAFHPEEALDQILIPALKAGARVLVVMNTVARAIAMFRAMENNHDIDVSWLFRCNGMACPHHGRFAPADREVLDMAVSVCLGRGSPPGPVLLVGTQTLEQSLDIDADLLITDLAPSDVLLQRVGRLHRHIADRPPEYSKPLCLVLVPEQSLEDAFTIKGEISVNFKRLGYGSVYEDMRTLELTCRFLRERSQVSIPADNRFFVESTTHPEALAKLTNKCWIEHGHLIRGKGLAKAITADNIANLFDQYFGDITFVETGQAVATRLGINQLHLPLDRKVVSPFGNILTEMVIPGYMAPDNLGDGVITIVEEGGGTIIMQCEKRSYRYSRYGLEEIS